MGAARWLAFSLLLLGIPVNAPAKSNCGRASHREEKLQRPQVIDGAVLPAGATVSYSDCGGTWRMSRVSASVDLTYRGVTLRGGLAFDDEQSFDESRDVWGTLADDTHQRGMTFRGGTHAVIDVTGHVITGELAEAYGVRGGTLPAGTRIRWDSDAKIFRADPPPTVIRRGDAEDVEPGELVVDALKVKGEAAFGADGRLRAAQLANGARLGGAPCDAGALILFHPGGGLKTCGGVSSEGHVNGMRAEVAVFYEDGSLHAVRSRVPGYGHEWERRWVCFQRDGKWQACPGGEDYWAWDL